MIKSIKPRHPIVYRPNSDYCTVVAMMMKRDTLLATVCFVLGYISCADCFTTTLRPTLQPTSNSLSKGTPTFVRTSDLRSNLNLSKENENVVGKFTKKFAQSLLSSLFIMSNVAAMTSGLTPLGPQPAEANDSRLIGEIPGSGIVFKDILNVESFDDPKVKVCGGRFNMFFAVGCFAQCYFCHHHLLYGLTFENQMDIRE